jgi:hypothetical protein
MSALAFQVLIVGTPSSAWPDPPTPPDTESVLVPPSVNAVVTEAEAVPFTDEPVGLSDKPVCQESPGSSDVKLSPKRSGKKYHLRPLFGCRPDDSYSDSVPWKGPLRVAARQSPVGLLNMLGFDAQPLPGSSSAIRVPGPGLPPNAMAEHTTNGGPFPGYGPMLPAYPTSVAPVLLMAPLDGPLLPNGERLPRGAVLLPSGPMANPPAPQPDYSASRSPAPAPSTPAVQPASLESALVELNTPQDPPSRDRAKPSSKFEAVAP